MVAGRPSIKTCLVRSSEYAFSLRTNFDRSTSAKGTDATIEFFFEQAISDVAFEILESVL